MKIRHQKNKKVIIAVVIIILLIVVAAGTIIYYQSHTDNTAQESSNNDQTSKSSNEPSDKNNPSDDSSDESTDQSDTSESDDVDSSAADNDPTNGGKTPPRYEGGAIQDSETLTGDISGINLVNGNLSIRVTVNQYINDPDGRCDLVLTDPSGNTHTFWSDLIANPQTSTCYGWDITADDLGGNIATGHWKASVTVTGDNRTGVFTKEVDL